MNEHLTTIENLAGRIRRSGGANARADRVHGGEVRDSIDAIVRSYRGHPMFGTNGATGPAGRMVYRIVLSDDADVRGEWESLMPYTARLTVNGRDVSSSDRVLEYAQSVCRIFWKDNRSYQDYRRVCRSCGLPPMDMDEWIGRLHGRPMAAEELVNNQI